MKTSAIKTFTVFFALGLVAACGNGTGPAKKTVKVLIADVLDRKSVV